MTRPAEAPSTIFVSYCHRDEAWKDRLVIHLTRLEPFRPIQPWDDRQIGGGDEWYTELRAAIDRAAVAVCLISRDYLVSEFVRWEEIPHLLARRAREGLCIVPVLLHPCDWQEVHWLKPLQLLPRDGRSVSGDFSGTEDEVFGAVARRVLEITSDPNYLPTPAAKPTWPEPGAVDLDRLSTTGLELFGRQAQLALLDQAWRSYDTHVVCYVGCGGAGKSTLIRGWLKMMDSDNYRGAERVFGWSFFSQGAGCRVASADLFVATALAWFGDPRPTEGSPWEKGERLAALVRRYRTLLILDGIEPLQSELDFEPGRIRDPALATLVADLARDNPGLCVITTRQEVPDLMLFPKTVALENLDHLSTEAARALLRVGGVHGSDAQLEAGARRFGNHAFALDLLAGYLRGSDGNRIADAEAISLLHLPEASGRHARSVMAAFAQRFGSGPEIDVLRLLSLFTRPARSDEIGVLRSSPAIPALTEHLVSVSAVEWLQLVERLRDVKLLAQKDRHDPESLDVHPLVREHFREGLRAETSDAWRAGNSRLFEHLQKRSPQYPNTLEQMVPLLEAIVHGCEAGRHQEALDLHHVRVQHGSNINFVTTALGAFGLDLAVLSFLFDDPWRCPAKSLVPPAKVALLGWVGYRLHALGRLTEAADAMSAGLEGRVENGDFKNAALEASNLSQLYLHSASIPLALEYAQRGVNLADRGTDAFWQMASRCVRAAALHHAGRLEPAADLFASAEKMNRAIDARYPMLYSLQGYFYCDLLLTLGRYREVRDRADWIVKSARHRRLDVGLGRLAMARAELLSLRRREGGDLSRAETSANQAIDVLRDSGDREWLPVGFFIRATIHRLRRRTHDAERDLRSGIQVAERAGLKLWLADGYVEAVRLHLSTGSRERAKEAFSRAQEIVQAIGCAWRENELREAEASLVRR